MHRLKQLRIGRQDPTDAQEPIVLVPLEELPEGPSSIGPRSLCTQPVHLSHSFINTQQLFSRVNILSNDHLKLVYTYVYISHLSLALQAGASPASACMRPATRLRAAS